MAHPQFGCAVLLLFVVGGNYPGVASARAHPCAPSRVASGVAEALTRPRVREGYSLTFRRDSARMSDLAAGESGPHHVLRPFVRKQPRSDRAPRRASLRG